MKRILLIALAVVLAAQSVYGFDRRDRRYPYGDTVSLFSGLVLDSTGKIVVQEKGQGTYTYARSTVQYVQDSVDGLWKAFNANEVPPKGRITGSAGSRVVYGTTVGGTELADWMYWDDPAQTNSCLESRTISTDASASWTESNATTADDATGLDGTVNGASTLTDADGANQGYVLQLVAIPNDSNTHTGKVYIKKDSDETRFPLIKLVLTTGGTTQFIFLSVNTKTGASSIRASAGTVAQEVNSRGDWWEVLLSVANIGDGNLSADIYVYPAYSNTLGGNDVSSTGSVIVGNAELYKDTTISEVRGMGPIFTTTAAVVTGAGTMVYNSGDISDASGLIFFTYTTPGAQNLVSTFAEQVGTDLQIDDGTTQDTIAAALDTEHDACLWWDAQSSQMAVCVDGSCNTPVAYDGTMLSGDFDLFRSGTFPAGMKNIKTYKLGTANQLNNKCVRLMQ